MNYWLIFLLWSQYTNIVLISTSLRQIVSLSSSCQSSSSTPLGQSTVNGCCNIRALTINCCVISLSLFNWPCTHMTLTLWPFLGHQWTKYKQENGHTDYSTRPWDQQFSNFFVSQVWSSWATVCDQVSRLWNIDLSQSWAITVKAAAWSVAGGCHLSLEDHSWPRLREI